MIMKNALVMMMEGDVLYQVSINVKQGHGVFNTTVKHFYYTAFSI